MPRLNAFTNKILIGKGLRRRVAVNITLASNITNYLLDPTSVSANGQYIAGQTDVTLTINGGVYVYSGTYLIAGLAVGAFTSGDTVSIINNGFIIGMGGGQGATTGGPAMNISYPVSLTNNSYIAGGGGAGGGSGGGGGAGGGTGVTGTSGGTGGAGGGPGLSGSNGIAGSEIPGGGGGGRILPGTGGSGVGSGGIGLGGGAGGSGSGYVAQAGQAWFTSAAGGGGGWGASGGSGKGGIGALGTVTPGNGGSANNAGGNGAAPNNATPILGSAGGKAVNLNGNTVTWLANGTRWGAIS